jgi:hypothetical protein
MTIADFNESIHRKQPPANLGPILLALWYDGKGDWEKSHQIIQDIETKDAAWIHAYLHRKEGDDFNAAYWYQRAGRLVPTESLEEEWRSLVDYFTR